jgi:hypothetical protein
MIIVAMRPVYYSARVLKTEIAKIQDIDQELVRFPLEENT